MAGHGREHHGPAAAGERLAELADRLRRCVGGGNPAGDPVWPSRLAAAAGCWRLVAREGGVPGCGALADGLQDLATALADGPPPEADLPARLAALDADLADLLATYDADGGAGLAADPRWAQVAPAAAAPARPPLPAAEADQDLILLIASPFLRDVLGSRLASSGRPVLPVTDPAAALRQLRSRPRRPALVICDNEEPTNHLRRLRRLLAGSGEPPPALFLVSTAGERAAGRERRARSAGADGVWAEPWRPEQLPTPAVSGTTA